MHEEIGLNITRHACLYETPPTYVTKQPRFLNSAVRAVTKLGPHELLGVLKKIEQDMGRTGGIRYGPRPIDLDILFYGKYRIGSDILTVSHERIWERPFVMAPLMDLLGSVIDSDTIACWHSFSTDSDGLFGSWEKLGGESLIGKEGMKRFYQLGITYGSGQRKPQSWVFLICPQIVLVMVESSYLWRMQFLMFA